MTIETVLKLSALIFSTPIIMNNNEQQSMNNTVSIRNLTLLVLLKYLSFLTEK